MKCWACDKKPLPGLKSCATHKLTRRPKGVYGHQAARDARKLDAVDRKLAELGRCHCGLHLPCEHESTDEIAGARNYVGIGWML